MGKLRSRRHSRALLGAPLSPTRSELNPEHLSVRADRQSGRTGYFVAPPTTPADPSSRGRAEAVTADATIYLAAAPAPPSGQVHPAAHCGAVYTDR
ncbi:MAG: hypothetical protein R2856_23370 [Caldilineaceae bacterium]